MDAPWFAIAYCPRVPLCFTRGYLYFTHSGYKTFLMTQDFKASTAQTPFPTLGKGWAWGFPMSS
jgi:hypothetical protein